MADLGKIDVQKSSNEGARMEIRHPGTGEIVTDDSGKAMYLTLVGKFSDPYLKAQRQLTDRRLKANVGRRNAKVSANQLEMEEAETLARCVIDSHLVVDGEEVAKDFEAYYQFFKNERFVFVRQAAADFVDDDGNFTNQS